MHPGELYDRIGVDYTATRRPDPRIARAIDAALGDARTVVNVGAGTGSYEPANREVVAVEPSRVMLDQRPPGSAPAVQANAEELPFPDRAFDASMAILTDHHWSDRRRGMRELRRVARSRVVVLTFDPACKERFWLTRDYLGASRRLPLMEIAEIASLIRATRVEPLPVPHDCEDGFYHAFWRRPEAYLDARVRAGISVFRRLPDADVDAAVERLRGDLESGRWHERNRELLELDEIDLGYRLIVAEA